MSGHTPKPSRRAPGEQIVAAAKRLLYETGEGFTIQQLVEEAGIALQTFYRYFPSKDQLLLAVLERTIAESCVDYERAAAHITDPVERLRYFVTTPLRVLGPDLITGARLVTREHFRLHQLFPAEVARATRPFTELVLGALRDATDAGQLAPIDVERDAWVITELVMTTYHHFAFADLSDASGVNDHLWRFCSAALGRPVIVKPEARRRRRAAG